MVWSKRWLKIIAVSVAFVLLATLLWGVVRVPDWSTETLGVFGGYEEKSYLVADSQGALHAIFVGIDGSHWVISHAERSGSHWNVETVYTWWRDPIYSREVSAAMDRQDRIHVCTYERGLHQLVYLTSGDSGWTVENVSADGDPGNPVIAVDEDGHAYVASDIEWYDGSATRHNLTMTTNAAGSWASEVLAQDSGIGDPWFDPYSVVVDGAGNPHIMFRSDGNTSLLTGGLSNSLVYGCKLNGSWSFSLIDTASKSFGQASMVMDDQDKAHVLYYRSPGARVADGTDYYLNYATDKNGTWTTRSIWHTGNFYPEGTDLVTDSVGNLHAVFSSNYYNDLGKGVSNHTLWYARASGTEWVKESVVKDIGVMMGGADPSIILNPESHASVLYCQHPKNGSASVTFATNEDSSAPYWSALAYSSVYTGVTAAICFTAYAAWILRRRRKGRAESRRKETGLNE